MSLKVVAADKKLQRMLADGRIDVPVLIELEDAFVAHEQLVGHHATAPERLLMMVSVWGAVSGVLDLLTDPARAHVERYARLEQSITNSSYAPNQPASIVDAIWALLRRVEIGRRELVDGNAAENVFSPSHWPSRQQFQPRTAEDHLGSLDAYEACMASCKANRWDHVNHLYLLRRSVAGVRWKVSMTSGERITFACREGHIVTVPAANRRNTFGSPYCGCGVCSGRHAVGGYNSLADTHPHVAERWHPSRNGALRPEDVRAGSSRSAWWLCRDGHDVEAIISNMVRRKGRTCRYCARREVVVGVTGLDVTHPEVARRWHPTLNGDLTPALVLSGSARVTWWLCEAGHAYDLSVALASTGTGCGVCRGMRAIAGVNTLQDRFPDIAAQWHPHRNGDLTPDKVTPGSRKNVWWICPLGHEWDTSVFRRKTRGCRLCANLEARSGVNSLADTHPALAAEWHPTYNGEVTPEAVVAGSPKIYWWQCPEGHPYMKSLVRRRDGQGCGYCSNRKVWSGYNDACTRFPNIMNDWDYERNDNFDPSNRLPSGDKHFWRCRRAGHNAFSTIPNRRLTRGCPKCDPVDRAGRDGD